MLPFSLSYSDRLQNPLASGVQGIMLPPSLNSIPNAGAARNLIEPPDKDLTARIISAAIAVHRILGPGFLESIYYEGHERRFKASAQFRRYAPYGQASWQRASNPFLIS